MANLRSSGASANSDIGDQGELWFAAELPRGWVWQPPRRDLGKDGIIVVRDDSKLHNLEFAVQIKSSVQPKTRDDQIVISGVSRSSVQYWFASPLPTLVVAVDITNRVGWLAWHLDLFESPKDIFDGHSNTFTLRIPRKNQICSHGWDSIRKHLDNHFTSLGVALSGQHIERRLMTGINLIVTNTYNLVKLAQTPPPDANPDYDDMMSLGIEQISHRDILFTVRYLLDKIDENSSVARFLRFWTESYESSVLEAFPTFLELPDQGFLEGDVTYSFAPKRMLDNRPRLILACLDLVKLLTSANAEKEAEQDAADQLPARGDSNAE